MTSGTRQRSVTVSGDLLVAVTLLVLGVAFAVVAWRAGIGSARNTGSGFFPFVVAVVLVAASVVVVRQEARGDVTELADEDDEDFRGDVNWPRVVGVLAAGLLVPAFAGTVGMIVMLSLTLFVIAKIMGLRSWLGAAALGVAFGAATWLIFVYWLFVPLPSGTLGLL